MHVSRKHVFYAVFPAFFLAIFLSGTVEVSAQGEAAGASVAGHIPGPASETARPVAVITRSDIELSGARNLRQLLERGLEFNTFGLFRPSVAGSGYRAVLVNGRRISDSVFDAEAFPLSAIERIEILNDNAAALHGGHAVGGAINIVLRSGFKGFEARAGAARPKQAGADSEHGGFVWGGALGRGRAVVGLDVVRREEIRDADRDYYRGSWTPGGSFEDARNISTGGNTLFISLPGEEGGRRTISRPLGACEGSAYISGLTEPRDIPGVGCGFDYSAIKWHYEWERLSREGLFLIAEHPIGESADIYLDARFAQSESTLLYAPSVGSFSFSPSQPLRDRLLQDPEIDALPDKIRVAHRFVAHGNREWITDVEERDLTLGVRGKLGGIGYDAHVRHYLHDLVVNGDTFVSATAIAKEIEDGRYNVEDPFSTDPDHLAAIRETSLRNRHDRVVEHTAAGASFNGEAFTLSGGEVLWAAGAEIASEEWRDVRDYRDMNGRSYDPKDVLGSGGSWSIGERDRFSAFAEVSLPLLKGWDVTLAGRHDDHDDVGATFSGRIASRYGLSKNLALRASWGAGGRPPALSVLHLRESVGYPYVCDVRTHTGHIRDCRRIQVERVDSGNPNLDPDEAESLSLGAAARFGPLSVSTDWFRIDISDAPESWPSQDILDLEAKGQLPAGVRVIRDGDLIDRIEGSYANIGENNVEGIDLRARVDLKADAAGVVFDLRWLRVTENEIRVSGEKVPNYFPRDRIHASVRVSRGRVTANWSVYGLSGYWNTIRSGRYRRWVGHDVTLRWRDAFGFRGMELIGGVLNVADRGPSTLPDGPALTFASARGRTLFVNAKYTFGP